MRGWRELTPRSIVSVAHVCLFRFALARALLPSSLRTPPLRVLFAACPAPASVLARSRAALTAAALCVRSLATFPSETMKPSGVGLIASDCHVSLSLLRPTLRPLIPLPLSLSPVVLLQRPVAWLWPAPRPASLASAASRAPPRCCHHQACGRVRCVRACRGRATGGRMRHGTGGAHRPSAFETAPVPPNPYSAASTERRNSHCSATSRPPRRSGSASLMIVKSPSRWREISAMDARRDEVDAPDAHSEANESGCAESEPPWTPPARPPKMHPRHVYPRRPRRNLGRRAPRWPPRLCAADGYDDDAPQAEPL